MVEAGFLLTNYEWVKTSPERVLAFDDAPVSVEQPADAVELTARRDVAPLDRARDDAIASLDTDRPT